MRRLASKKVAITLIAFSILLPYTSPWLVYLSPGLIDFYGTDVIVIALPLVLVVICLLIWGRAKEIAGVLSAFLSLIPIYAFFQWGMNSFAFGYSFFDHVSNKIKMTTISFWAAIILPILLCICCWSSSDG